MSEASQSLTQARWHGQSQVVFVPNRRRQALVGQIRQAREPIFQELARQQEWRSLAGHLMPDHVPLGIAIPPKDAVASVIGSLQGQRAIAMARQCAGRDRHCAGEHCWARGSAVSTVGWELEQGRAYIRDQEDADGAGRF